MLLAGLSRSLDLSPGPLGFALFVGAAASIVSMALLGWTADRIGRRLFVAVSSGVLGAGIVGLSLTSGYAGLLVALVVLYSASGLYDIGINASAVDLEKKTGRRFMAVLHATFSAGGVAGALSAGALLQAGVDYRQVYLVVLVPLGAVVLAVSFTRFPTPAAPEPGGKQEAPKLYRSLPLLLIALIAFFGLLSEGEMEQWSGVYLLRTLELPALLGASGVAVFYGAMAFGRLCSAWIIGRFGDRTTLLGAGLLTAAGMALALATRQPPVVVAGFLLVGLALSAVVPMAFSAAGDYAPNRAGGAVSVVTTLGYGGFLLGPVLVGGLAESFGLRTALGVVALAGLTVFALATRLKPS